METEIYEFTDEELVAELKSRGYKVKIRLSEVRGLSDQKLKELSWDINPTPIAHWMYDEQQYDHIHKIVTPTEVLEEIKRRAEVKRLADIIG